MTARTFGFFALLAIAAAGPASGQDEALRGKTAMSVYVSVYGDNEIYSAGLRLALEQQLHDIGITVLPHGDPPNYPVLNLTITVEARDVNKTTSNNRIVRVKVVDYTNKLELKQLAPGRTREMRPIKDVAIWTLGNPEKQTAQMLTWGMADEALDLTIDFVKRWVRVNGRHRPTPDVPMPVPNPNAHSPPSDKPGQPLHKSDSCETPAGGGCVYAFSVNAVGSVFDVPGTQRAMVQQQIEDQKKRGQQVITCEYGPTNLQTGQGFAVFHYWYKSAPPDILKLLVSAFPHPMMELGRVAVASCPATRALASVVKASRFN